MSKPQGSATWGPCGNQGCSEAPRWLPSLSDHLSYACNQLNC